MRVYEKVRAYIEENGYKQVVVAQKAGISKATFSAILNGKRTLSHHDALIASAELQRGTAPIHISSLL